MANLSISENNELNTAQMELSGEFVLEEAAEIQSKLQAASDKYAEIHISLKEIKQIDMAGIQLLLALDKKMKANNKILRISFDLDKDKQELLTKAGFSDLFNN